MAIVAAFYALPGQRMEETVSKRLARRRGAGIFVVVDKFALLEQWPAETPKAENAKNDMQRSLLKLATRNVPLASC